MSLRAASMRHHHLKRYHSIHPNWNDPRDYRAYLSMDCSAGSHDPNLMANMDENLFEEGICMELGEKFKRMPKTPEDADDEEDDPEQTPTVERPEPDFQRIKKA